jgi:hypothetical protein
MVIITRKKIKIKYQFQSIPEMMANYFNIIDESNDQLLKLINKLTINHPSGDYQPSRSLSMAGSE